MTIKQDIQTLDPGALIELFIVDLSMLPGGPVDPYRFHSGVNQLNTDIVWQGNTYARYSVEADGFELTTQGQLPRPKMRVSNAEGFITTLVLSFNDMVGGKVIRVRTLGRYLDAINFPGGVNPDANPTQEFPREVFYIERKVSESKDSVEFELASSLDLWGIKLPRRQIVRNICTWKYKSPECSYVPGPMFLIDDTPTGNPALDVCGKHLSSCKVRFGANSVLPYGGYPSAGLIR
jgi:lambda family phage minor tail protein L